MPMPPKFPPGPSLPATPSKAVALEYDRASDAAPKVTAKGHGIVAENILRVAREHGIPLQQDADLLQLLEHVELGSEIPMEVYAVVAEIFAFLYKTNQQAAGKSAAPRPPRLPGMPDPAVNPESTR